MKTARWEVSKPGSISYALWMLRRNKAAVTSKTNENATWLTTSAFASVTLLRLRPAVRAPSFSASARVAPEDRKAGMIPNRKPVAREMTNAKANTVASSFGATKFADPGNIPNKSFNPAWLMNNPNMPLRNPRNTLSVRS